MAVEHGESVEVQRIIDAAESSDPDGNPGIWDVASQRHVYPQPPPHRRAGAGARTPNRSWSAGGPRMPTGEVTQTDTERQKDYREGKD